MRTASSSPDEVRQIRSRYINIVIGNVPPLARYLPSRENARQFTGPVLPLSRSRRR